MKRYSSRMDYDMIEMLTLRTQYWSSTRLARKYGKDHSTILHHCKRYGAYPGGPVPTVLVPAQRVWESLEEETIDKRPPKPLSTYKYAYLFDEPINVGKLSYREYEKEALKRPAEAAYRKMFGRMIGPVTPYERARFLD